MILQLNPLLDALKAARSVVLDSIHADDEVTVDDRSDRWIFEFIPREDSLGGGAKVSVSKSDFEILEVIRMQ